MSDSAGWLPALIAAYAVVIAVARLVAEKEYPYWSYRAGAWLIRAASFLVPRSERDRYFREWMAELDEATKQGGALCFALSVVSVGAIRIGIRRMRAVLLPAACFRHHSFAEAFAVGLGCDYHPHQLRHHRHSHRSTGPGQVRDQPLAIDRTCGALQEQAA